VGDRVEVYYPEEDEWCQGEVVGVNRKRTKHTVRMMWKEAF
jgi:hypothetical protein